MFPDSRPAGSRSRKWSENRPAAAAKPAASGMPTAPASAIAAVSSVVATGRRINGAGDVHGSSREADSAPVLPSFAKIAGQAGRTRDR